MKLTLPTDSGERKRWPLFRGALRYFPAAIAGIARISFIGNEKHNPGEEMHHARGKSTDLADCVIRHMVDVEDMLAANARAAEAGSLIGPFGVTQILDEVDQFAWRACAWSQEIHERLGAPLAPGARLPAPQKPVTFNQFPYAGESPKPATMADAVHAGGMQAAAEWPRTPSAPVERKAAWLCPLADCTRPLGHSGACYGPNKVEVRLDI